MDIKDKINDLLKIVDSLSFKNNAAATKVIVTASIADCSWQQESPVDELESAVTRLRDIIIYELEQYFRKNAAGGN